MSRCPAPTGRTSTLQEDGLQAMTHECAVLETSESTLSRDRVEVSVIICVHNGASTILRQLEALDRQVGAPVFEIIIVDNLSTDDTRATVERWMRDRSELAPAAKVIGAMEKAHIPYARNRGALASTGRIMAFCDADDVVSSYWVSAISGCLDRPGIVGGKLEAVTRAGVPVPSVFANGLTETHYLPHAGNSNLAISRDCFIALGGYDESLPRYGYEDVDISWRAQERGFPIGYCEDAVVRFSLSPRRIAVRKQFLLAKGRVLIAQRHPHAYEPFTLASCLRTLLSRVGLLPYRLIRPGGHRRSRHVAWAINAVGHLAGYRSYVARRVSPTPILIPSQELG